LRENKRGCFSGGYKNVKVLLPMDDWRGLNDSQLWFNDFVGIGYAPVS
jgi:hypothetical protein